MDPVIIIGTGMAAYTLAREFRKRDLETPVLLISEDDGRSYPKPMLSNALTKGKTAEQVAMFDAATMATKLNADIMTHTVVETIDPNAKTIRLGNGTSLVYDKLVLAVGANPIRIPIEGNASADILSVNNLADYTIFRDKLIDAQRVAIIGPGLIGCEFANDLLNVGTAVSIIGPSALPMDALLPEPIAEELKLTLASDGVDWHLETTTESINYADDGYELSLTNGDIVHADIVISAVGLRANIKLAESAGLNINRGIVTDQYLQTSQSDIYALGDCAEVSGHNLLFIAPIMAAAKALASTLSAEPKAVKYPAMPVAIKTPSYPLITAPPARNSKGEWHFEKAESGFGIKGLFVGADDALLGFVLSGDTVSEKSVLSKQLPDLLG
ncbi:MAG: FAD-dependent oxidoreductase [Gammaproteobacteria bacterium]|nr:FAD-dependent oxidoreductase [Gammaproteobacteria bacterium]